MISAVQVALSRGRPVRSHLFAPYLDGPAVAVEVAVAQHGGGLQVLYLQFRNQLEVFPVRQSVREVDELIPTPARLLFRPPVAGVGIAVVGIVGISIQFGRRQDVAGELPGEFVPRPLRPVSGILHDALRSPGSIHGIHVVDGVDGALREHDHGLGHGGGPVRAQLTVGREVKPVAGMVHGLLPQFLFVGGEVRAVGGQRKRTKKLYF